MGIGIEERPLTRGQLRQVTPEMRRARAIAGIAGKAEGKLAAAKIARANFDGWMQERFGTAQPTAGQMQDEAWMTMFELCKASTDEHVRYAAAKAILEIGKKGGVSESSDVVERAILDELEDSATAKAGAG